MARMLLSLVVGKIIPDALGLSWSDGAVWTEITWTSVFSRLEDSGMVALLCR
jgi:hypothetical protein